MIKKFLLPSLIVLLFSSCGNTLLQSAKELPSGKYELDMGHSSIHFKVSHLGLSYYTARFTDFDADLNFNPNNIEKSSLKAKVKVGSIKTDYNVTKKNFDKFLSKDKSWFNSTKFPYIKFESTDIIKKSKNKAIMLGNLTLLGVTKSVKFDVTFNGSYKNKPFANKPALGFSAEAQINRSDFGFATFIPSIGDKVKIIIETEFHKY